ncbi:MAG: hypothetical protein F4160_18870 [Rhodospirillaceae bacterium]|nr:hypothetical protein [Rhodospirillaceae bacterium]MYF86563.1 hypothetical protein [Rhodospirillaceae bacterium]MYH38853.1 hypothetical protein [Rhodospirillaceae bacterium]MYK16450.1 hypothetical protein [Rhodospirillaceae bacterium]
MPARPRCNRRRSGHFRKPRRRRRRAPVPAPRPAAGWRGGCRRPRRPPRGRRRPQCRLRRPARGSVCSAPRGR